MQNTTMQAGLVLVAHDISNPSSPGPMSWMRGWPELEPRTGRQSSQSRMEDGPIVLSRGPDVIGRVPNVPRFR